MLVFIFCILPLIKLITHITFIPKELDIEMHCEKGTGKEHAKWSPVGKYHITISLICTNQLNNYNSSTLDLH